MIKKEELRIGNFVEYYEDGLEFVVTKIDELGIGVKNEDPETAQKTWIEYDCFSPIKLTEEQLRRFKWQLVRKDDFYINSYFSLDKYCHVYYSNDYTGLNIDCVHQLQNLVYALTGGELNLL